MGRAAGSIGQAKVLLKNNLIKLWRKKYRDELLKKTATYDTWIREKEERVGKRLAEQGRNALTVRRIGRNAFSSFISDRKENALTGEEADICLFLMADGRENRLTEALIIDYFEEHSRIELAYGDEDVISPDGIRYTPWLKPDWSPDTFSAMFYFGSVFAVRTSALKRLTEEEIDAVAKCAEEDVRLAAYGLCGLLAEKCGGFAKRETPEAFPIGHIDEILFHTYNNVEMDIPKKGGFPAAEPEVSAVGTKEPLISVIIPSKDNPDILMRCIESIKRTVTADYEIIVVDNGSAAGTKELLAGWLKRQSARYIYEKQPFHFSRMCNTGAKAAKGNILLFLNDDVEAVKAGWMESLCTQAAKPYAGAAGVKLLYPHSEKIQHAGIVNLRLGPVHKLQFMSDEDCYYYRWNRGTRNVLAVTGACLAVEKTKFKEAGGFPEELPVAFNDVSLCFALYEKGYYNCVLQDCRLFHHESLSRGRDEERVKLERLLAEKRKLYMRHRELYGRDPFYHKYLAGDMLSSDFDTGADYEWKETMPFSKIERGDGIVRNAGEDGCVLISLEYAGTIEEWKQGISIGKKEKAGGEAIYYLQGYAFVSGSDNACYEKKIILGRVPEERQETEKAGIIAVTPEILRRADVERNLPDQINVGLTGFRAKLRGKEIKTGSYRIGMLVKDRCSGQRLYAWTNRYLEVRDGL